MYDESHVYFMAKKCMHESTKPLTEEYECLGQCFLTVPHLYVGAFTDLDITLALLYFQALRMTECCGNLSIACWSSKHSPHKMIKC